MKPPICLRFLLHLLRHVGVDIQRKLRRVVAQHPGYRLWVDSILQGHCGEGPAEVVEADVLLDPGPLQQLLVDAPHAVRAVHPTCHRGGEQVGVGRVLFVVIHQQTDGHVINIDGADGFFRLRFRHLQLAFTPDYGFGYRQTLSFDIWAAPGPRQGCGEEYGLGPHLRRHGGAWCGCGGWCWRRAHVPVPSVHAPGLPFAGGCTSAGHPPG